MTPLWALAKQNAKKKNKFPKRETRKILLEKSQRHHSYVVRSFIWVRSRTFGIDLLLHNSLFELDFVVVVIEWIILRHTIYIRQQDATIGNGQGTYCMYIVYVLVQSKWSEQSAEFYNWKCCLSLAMATAAERANIQFFFLNNTKRWGNIRQFSFARIRQMIP